MSITVHETRLLALLQSEIQARPLPGERLEAEFQSMTQEDWNGLMTVAQANRAFPLLLEALRRNPSIPVPMPVGRFLQQNAMQNSMAFYQKLSLLSSLAELTRQEGIHAYLLKGLGLNALYPHEESRCFADIDLYIPDSGEYRRLLDIFQSRGYEKETEDMTDYHHGFHYQREGISCTVELHYRLTTSYQTGDFDRRLASIYEQGMEGQPPRTIQLMGLEFQALPVTMEALYLLMHMFQHFMNKGFGLRLFTDWVVFWSRLGDGVDSARFCRWVRELGLDAFLDAINSICVRYLGMRLPSFGWLQGQEDSALAQELLEDVFSGGEFGHLDRNRISVTSRRPGLKAYLMELHRQTKRRYPRASKIKILLPVLWVSAAVIFQYNNLFRRGISLRGVIASNNLRNQLAKKLHIFDES